jgi:zinc protease
MKKTELLKRPPVRTVDLPAIAEPEKIIAGNGVPVYLIDAGTEDIVRIDFTLNAGSIVEKIPLTSSTTSMMLTEGTLNHKAQEINRILDSICVYFNPYSERDRAGITVCFLNKHIEKVLELTREIMFFPSFPNSELKLMMDKRLRSFLLEKEKVHSLAADKFFESVFGSSHPYGRIEVPDDFKKIKKSTLIDFHKQFYRESNMAVIISGRIPANMNLLLNKCLENTDYKTIEEDGQGLPLKQTTEKKLHIDKKGAVQSAIRIGYPTINKRHEDYQGLKVVNTILGGYFGSRLMKNIREEKGYTYGISSSLVSLIGSGYFSISTEVSNKFTHYAIDEIYNEIRRLQSEAVGIDELTVVKNFMLGNLVRMFDGPFATAECFRSVLEYGLNNSWFASYVERIKSISPEEIMALAQKYLNIEDMYEITAG